MAKGHNTQAKRQREMEKRAKAESKRARRDKRKQGDVTQGGTASQDTEHTDEVSEHPES